MSLVYELSLMIIIFAKLFFLSFVNNSLENFDIFITDNLDTANKGLKILNWLQAFESIKLCASFVKFYFMLVDSLLITNFEQFGERADGRCFTFFDFVLFNFLEAEIDHFALFLSHWMWI